ncbi:MAG: mitochondrial fission ELM1 family protein [Hydrogenophilaceae bacterium]|nr:mitochondrial fission ELM1 family protein [Hydrogenophilaceae bacterium]
MRFSPDSPLVIWRLIDGKPGHEKQGRGLAEALGRHVAVKIHEIRANSPLASLTDWLLGRFPAGKGLADPHLLIGAGHRTHLGLLAARRARGGRAVVLMQPSLPLGLFDLCLIPAHDRPPARTNVIATRGALSTTRPSRQHDAGLGLILVGGPSRHFGWNSRQIAGNIAEIVHKIPNVRWHLTNSRRTPADFLGTLAQAGLPNLEILPFDTTPPGWLETELARAGQAWVTEDSVSMVYEALTAGCAVGLLRLPRRGDSRVARGVDQLIRDNWVTPFDTWQSDHPLLAAPEGFDEAERCARKILEKWFA